MLSRVLVAALLGVAHADVYMHNPRGSNDRNCERNVNRNNGNRLFDSQNNAKGYVWPAVSWKLESAAASFVPSCLPSVFRAGLHPR